MSVGSSGSDYDLLAAPVTPTQGQTSTAAAAAASSSEQPPKESTTKAAAEEMPRLFFAGE